MKVDVVGGGPAGLFFANLAKRNRPDWRITVHERRRSFGDVSGGIALPAQAIGRLARHDGAIADEIRSRSTPCDSIDVEFEAQSVRLHAENYLCCARSALLEILHKDAVSLGVELLFGREIQSPTELGDANLIVVADGANSRIRDYHKERFRPVSHQRQNKFIWLDSTAPLDGYRYIFRDAGDGILVARCFPYEDRSSWLIEADDTTWRSLGLDRCDDNGSLATLQDAFADVLSGHPLMSNGSFWSNYSIVRSSEWVADNTVLLGDARENVHYLQDSGVVAAMLDATALAKTLNRVGSPSEALSRWNPGKRDLSRVRHDVDVALARFEHRKRYKGMDPAQFAFGLLAQTHKVTWETLEVRDPAFVNRLHEPFRAGARSSDYADSANTPPPMFAPFRLRGMVLENRVVVSPMDQYSSVDGVPGDWHFLHLCSRAVGGAGMVCVEMSAPSPDGRISPGDAGIWSEQHRGAFKRIVDFCHANSKAKVCMQLGHAGRKGSTQLSWQHIDHPLEQDNWPLIAASPIPYLDGISQIPREMTRGDIDRVIADFRRSTKLSDEAGFDMLELHMAHGYLLASFISPLTNQRTDEYGGSVQNRMRFPLELFRACREVWPGEKPMGVRISATDWAPGGLTAEEMIAGVRMFKDAGCDLIDCSTGQTVPHQRPAYGGAYQSPFSELIRNEVGIATIAVGGITTPDQVNTLLASGSADLVALGRPHMTNPYFTLHAAAWYQHKQQHWPQQYLFGRGQALQQAARDRSEWINRHNLLTADFNEPRNQQRIP